MLIFDLASEIWWLFAVHIIIHLTRGESAERFSQWETRACDWDQWEAWCHWDQWEAGCHCDQWEADDCVICIMPGPGAATGAGHGSLAPHNEYKHHYCHYCHYCQHPPPCQHYQGTDLPHWSEPEAIKWCMESLTILFNLSRYGSALWVIVFTTPDSCTVHCTPVLYSALWVIVVTTPDFCGPCISVSPLSCKPCTASAACAAAPAACAQGDIYKGESKEDNNQTKLYFI